MNFYIINLMKEFIYAIGTKNIDVNSKQFIEEFSLWLKERKTISKKYIYFLDSLDLRFADSSCAEIGKGKYDSIVKLLDTTIITPYSKTFENSLNNRIITGNIHIQDGTPLLFQNAEFKTVKKEIPSSIIDTYMTQNPSKTVNIPRWGELYNIGERSIIIGAYGSVYDNDIDLKINNIAQLKDILLDDDFVEEKVIDNDSYFYVISADKKLRKTKKYFI